LYDITATRKANINYIKPAEEDACQFRYTIISAVCSYYIFCCHYRQL